MELKKIQAFFIHLLYWIIQGFAFLKRRVAWIIFYPVKIGKSFSRFLFYKIIVKLYRFYLYVFKKIGWAHFKKKSLFFVFNQKPLHFSVAFLTVFFTIFNIISLKQTSAVFANHKKTILNQLIKNEFSDASENDDLIEEFFNQEAILSSLKQTYSDNLISLRLRPVVDYNFKEVIDTGTSTGLVNNQAIIQKRSVPFNYVVKSGDTVSTIAREFGLNVDTILWENNLNSHSIIRPGDNLIILPENGVSYLVKSGDTLIKIASRHGVDEGDIMKINNLKDVAKLKIGDKLFIPGGKKQTYAQVSNSTRYSGLEAIGNIVVPPAKKVVGSSMLWPTEGHRITQYYSWRHTGLDIANKTGTPLYASDSGTVEYAGWGNGYGNEVVINHGGGKKTRYAHASKLFVKKGQFVNKGETVAAMGSTGWSTGPHIHFEVIINGVKYNPLNYIK